MIVVNLDIMMAKRKMSENSLKNLEKANPKNNFNNSEVARKAQEKATEVKREKKALREELILLLSQGKTQEKMSLAIIEEAIKGNVKAFEVIRDTIGEKPKDIVENINPPVINISGVKI